MSPEICPNHDHDLSDSPYRTTVKQGPMEGDWLVYPLPQCDAFTMGAVGGGEDSLASLIAALEGLGMNPTVNQGGGATLQPRRGRVAARR